MTQDATPNTANEKLKNDLIDTIIEHDNGLLMISRALAGFNEGGRKAYEDMNRRFDPERSRLRALSITELQQHLAAKQRRSVENAAIAARTSEFAKLEKAAQVDASKFYNLPSSNADFEHWSKAEYWTLEESVALLLGKDPRVVSSTTLKPHNPTSTTITFLAAQKPAASTGFLRSYETLLDLANRWQAMQNSVRLIPQEVLNWAKRTEAAKPDALLIDLVSRRAQKQVPIGAAPALTASIQETETIRSEANAGSAKKRAWTPEKIAVLEAYRATHTADETQAQFGISKQRIRKLISEANRPPAAPTANNPFFLKKR